MQRELWFRSLWYHLGAMIVTGFVAIICLPSNVTYGATSPGLAMLTGISLTFASSLLANWWIARRFGRCLNEVHNVLNHLQKASFHEQLSSDSYVVLPDIADTLEHSVKSVESQISGLSRDRDRLRNMINSMAEAVIAVDGNQTILLINTAACKIFSLNEQTVLGRPVWEQIRNPKLQSWVTEVVEKSTARGGELQQRGQITRELALNIVPLQNSSPGGAVIVATDVTELRRLETVRQQFVANASHELKTPIASIQACIETLIDGAVEDLQCRDRFLQTINEQAERLDLLVKDMLTLARLDADPAPREPHPVHVAKILEICVERHLQAAQKKSIELSVDATPLDLQLMADEDVLEHILDNLIDNAIKYTPESGTVRLVTETDNEFCHIHVIDTGIGIPQHQLARIFERFYRVDRHRSRNAGGTGLGLSIVKHLVQTMAGSVTVTSKVNEGSKFSIHLRMPHGTPNLVSSELSVGY